MILKKKQLSREKYFELCCEVSDYFLKNPDLTLTQIGLNFKRTGASISKMIDKVYKEKKTSN